VIPVIVILAVTSVLPAAAATWEDYIAEYRATEDPAQQISYLEKAIGAWSEAGDEQGYLAWTRKSLSDLYYGQAMPLVTRFMDDAAASEASGADSVRDKALQLLDMAMRAYPTPYAEY